VNRLKLMLIGLTFLSAASPRTVAQLDKDAGTRMLGVHELQATLREFGYGKFYAMTLNVPNLNSAGGSWVMHYVELKDAEKPGELVAPVAIQEVDPGYPLELMKENVQGTVVLSDGNSQRRFGRRGVHSPWSRRSLGCICQCRPVALAIPSSHKKW
jgi:hypothetical protein